MLVKDVVELAPTPVVPRKSNWPATVGAELVALEKVLRGRKEVARVKHAIAHEFKRPAVQRVRARAGHDVHDRSGIVPLSGRIVAGLDRKLL